MPNDHRSRVEAIEKEVQVAKKIGEAVLTGQDLENLKFALDDLAAMASGVLRTINRDCDIARATQILFHTCRSLEWADDATKGNRSIRRRLARIADMLPVLLAEEVAESCGCQKVKPPPEVPPEPLPFEGIGIQVGIKPER